MLVVETIAKIRRAYFQDKKPIKQICRELRVSRNTVRRVIDGQAGATRSQRNVLPIVTTVMGSDSAIVAALSAGAEGYILKNDPPGLIEQHLQMIGEGIPPLSPAVARRVMDQFRATGPNTEDTAALTSRESEVLSLIARGLRVADVAQTLDLAPSTVASHIKAIYRKLNISSRAEATYQAARMGLMNGPAGRVHRLADDEAAAFNDLWESSMRNTNTKHGNSMIALQRRSFVFGTASAMGLAAAPFGFGAGPARAAERKITWGTNEAYSRPEMLQPFTAATGIEVETALFSDPAELVTKLAAGGAGVDMMIDGSYHVDITHDAGVLQPLDPGAIPNLDTVIPAFRDAEGLSFDGKTYGAPLLWGTDSMVYRGDMVDGEINDLGALFDSKYAGRIAMPGGLLESLIVGAIYLGIDKPFDMTAADLDAVVELLIAQKPLLRTYWNDIGDLKNLMATGEVVLAWGWAPVMELVKDGIDVRWGFPSQGQLGWYDACYLTTE
eukprot:jgi/Tetstr1/429003/TSEL_018978.t1